MFTKSDYQHLVHVYTCTYFPKSVYVIYAQYICEVLCICTINIWMYVHIHVCLTYSLRMCGLRVIYYCCWYSSYYLSYRLFHLDFWSGKKWSIIAIQSLDDLWPTSNYMYVERGREGAWNEAMPVLLTHCDYMCMYNVCLIPKLYWEIFCQ